MRALAPHNPIVVTQILVLGMSDTTDLAGLFFSGSLV